MVPIDVNHSTDGNFPSDLETVNIVIFKDPSARALNFARPLRFEILAALGSESDLFLKNCLPAGISGKSRYHFDSLRKTSHAVRHFFACSNSLEKKFFALWKSKNGSFKNLHKKVQKVALVLDAPSGFGNTLVYYLSGLSDASTIIYPRRA
jgi:hypothetical protein